MGVGAAVLFPESPSLHEKAYSFAVPVTGPAFQAWREHNPLILFNMQQPPKSAKVSKSQKGELRHADSEYLEPILEEERTSPSHFAPDSKGPGGMQAERQLCARKSSLSKVPVIPRDHPYMIVILVLFG